MEKKTKHVSTENSSNMTFLMCKEMKHQIMKYDCVGTAKLIEARGIDEPVWMIELRKDNFTSFLIYETISHYMYIASILVYVDLLPNDKLYEKLGVGGKVLRRGRIIQDSTYGITMRWKFL